MLLPLMLSLAGSPLAPATAASARVMNDDPPVKVWLNHDNFQRGDRARVNVRLGDDGYVVVLRADADGRVRVLFPLDPGDDAFVRGGETIEVRGRGDREAFYVDEREGSGLVVAARSATPFKFDPFVRGDHWDYRVLDVRQSGDDKEAALVDIVQRMTDGHFDYDGVSYVVSAQRAYRDYYPSYYSVGYDWGWPYYRHGYYGSCYDAFFYDPFYCGAAYYRPFYDPFFFGGFGFVYRRPFVYRPFIYYTGGATFYNQPHNLFVNRLGSGGGSGLYFKDRPGTNFNTAGIGPRSRSPFTFVSHADPRSGNGGSSGVTVRERPASRDHGAQPDHPNNPGRPDVRSRPDNSNHPDHPARPSDETGSRARQPERREPSRGGDRPAVERPRDSGGGNHGGWSAPPSRGGGAGGGNRGGGGGGGRRRP
jgi:hypothetical protein